MQLFRKTMKWPQMGWVWKLPPVIFIHSFINPQQWSARLWGVSCILNFDSWGCCFDWWMEIMVRPATCLLKRTVILWCEGNGYKVLFWWLRWCFESDKSFVGDIDCFYKGWKNENKSKSWSNVRWFPLLWNIPALMWLLWCTLEAGLVISFHCHL